MASLFSFLRPQQGGCLFFARQNEAYVTEYDSCADYCTGKQKSKSLTAGLGPIDTFADCSLKAIGARLLVIRVEARLTQAEFAKALGVSLRTYHHYEKGQNACSTETLAVLSEKLGVDLNWFVTGREAIGSYKDADRIAEFIKVLDQYLEQSGIKLSPEKRRAIIARWYQGSGMRRAELKEDVLFWIDMVR